MPNGVTFILPTRLATTQFSQAKHVFSAGSWPGLDSCNRLSMKFAIPYAWLRLLVDRFCSVPLRSMVRSWRPVTKLRG